MFYIVVANAAVFVAGFVFADVAPRLNGLLVLSPQHVLRGEVWRLITFIFVPGSGNLLSMAISLYLYYIIGQTLEARWGSFHLNAYYLLGVLSCIVAAFITGYPIMSANEIHLTLFLAFACLVPDMQLLLFFIIPVKVKWLGWLSWVFIGYQFFASTGFMAKLLVLIPLANYFIFFGADIKQRVC